MYDGRWTPEKVASGEKITYPRVTYNYTFTDNNFIASDYWMKPLDFLRLKNIDIGYTFRSQDGILKRLKLNALRVYANGNNILTFRNNLSAIGVDPETPDNRRYIFPLISTYNFGVNLQF